jgi:preprotein translocase subunit SecA
MRLPRERAASWARYQARNRSFSVWGYPWRMPSLLDRALNVGEAKRFKTYQKRVALIEAFEAELEHDSDAELRERMDALRARAGEGGRSTTSAQLDALLPECFAIVRETGKRTMGMRHFDVQMIGGMALHEGQIAEMKTGEGKTLTATLAVVLNSLAVHDADPDAPEGAPRERRGVHVVTVNDYLARRDAEWMSPIYDALGVTVGVLENMQPYDEKQRAYACDVVYGTNSEFGFDYLRDNMAKDLSEKVQRGHCFAIVDEVDNILIDEARTPLIISGAPEQAADLYVKFARLAPQMKMGETPEGMDPRTKKQFVAEFDFEIDEKQKTVAITEQGVAKAERFLGIDHLYRAENGHLVNHLIQALRAQALYKRDVDYAVIDGEVKIIDEFTGRILDGRRWSEGLHQAIEAKEGVPVQEENQTLATITYQNYFRLYDKLAGMTGTALTEATEFMKIYELPVVQIPTNQAMIRDDRNDQVYKTKEGKWNAVVKEIVARNEAGQPVLVGTISVEVSELLGERLKQRGIKHTVLNAKPEHAALEAETVAEAGQPGAVTIATNMAGRGVDIKLGGNPEHLAALQLAREGVDRDDTEAYERRIQEILPELERKVAANRETVTAAGGLFICGTERHESRRIDNQLRGRAGRQGDPGESRFFLSAEDDLVRLFAGDRIYRILDKLGGVDEDGNEEPIEAGMLSKQIEKAQKKVEEQNFLIRKRVLEYDDVMNEQRRVIYKYRDEVLEGKSIGEEAREEVAKVIERTIDQYTPGDFVEDWDMDGLFTALGQFFPLDIGEEDLRRVSADRNSLSDRIVEEALARYNAREEALGTELMEALERFLLLQTIDERWREHLFDMDYLREGIHLRGFAQIDPLVAYKNEAFTLFGDLMNSVWSDYARMIFNVQVNIEGQNGGNGGGARESIPPFSAAGSSTRAGRVSYSGGHSESGAGALAAAAAAAGLGTGGAQGAFGEDGQELEALPVVEQRVLDDEHQVGRNDPCWCGSGKKFKKCHGA